MNTKEFLQLILPDQGVYFLAHKNPYGKGFVHEDFTNIGDMAKAVLDLSSLNVDVYFAPASYLSAGYTDPAGRYKQRTAENVECVSSVWLDIDCGNSKAATGDGYQTQEEALRHVHTFCHHYSLPYPMVLSSGNGVHCYWVFEKSVTPKEWRQVAQALKGLNQMGAVPLLADPSRTADVASLMRPIGTQNFKSPKAPKPVTLLQTGSPIDFQDFSRRVLNAKPPPNNLVRTQQSPPTPQSINSQLYADTAKALSQLDPDCSRAEWWRNLAVLADVFGEGGRNLARGYSSGELKGVDAEKYDPEEFERQFDDCLRRRDSYTGRRANLGSIFRAAGLALPQAVSDEEDLPEWLKEMNSQYAFIDNPAGIYRLKHDDYISLDLFKLRHRPETIAITVGDKQKIVTVADAWISDKNRRYHAGLTFEPNGPSVTDKDLLNLWQGLDTHPAPGCVKPFLRLLYRLIPDPKASKYVLRWLAHLFQTPQVKLNTALVIHSQQQGVGKNLLFETIQAIIGPHHSTLIGQAELESEFNAWARHKILIIGDEVDKSARRDRADKLKSLITGTSIIINEKHEKHKSTPNHANFVFLSNSPEAIYIDQTDRRYFVWNVTADPLTEAQASEYVEWRDQGGLSALLNFFLSINLAAFNPKAHAPNTVGKQMMIRSNNTSLEDWCAELVDDNQPDAKGVEVITVDAVISIYCDPIAGTNPRVTSKAVTNALRKAGARPLDRQVTISRTTGIHTKVTKTKRVRVWVLCNHGTWEKQPDAAVREELQKLGERLW